MLKLALILIVLTQEEPEPRLLMFLAPELKEILIKAEILDKRELRYVLSKFDEVVSDWHMIQRRANDLKDAPYLVDHLRFTIDRSTVNELLLFNRAYRQHLDNCIPLYPQDANLRLAREENEILYQVWDCVRDAKCEYYYTHIRRQALVRLLKTLGEKDFYEGQMPPHVPIWRFTAIR